MTNQPEWAVRYNDEDEVVSAPMDEPTAHALAADYNRKASGAAWAEPVRKDGDQWMAVQ